MRNSKTRTRRKRRNGLGETTSEHRKISQANEHIYQQAKLLLVNEALASGACGYSINALVRAAQASAALVEHEHSSIRERKTGTSKRRPGIAALTEVKNLTKEVIDVCMRKRGH